MTIFLGGRALSDGSILYLTSQQFSSLRCRFDKTFLARKLVFVWTILFADARLEGQNTTEAFRKIVLLTHLPGFVVL
jgi:hypothetical protein